MDNTADHSAEDPAHGDVPDWQLRNWYDHLQEAMTDLQENNDVRAYDRLQQVRDQLEDCCRERGAYHQGRGGGRK